MTLAALLVVGSGLFVLGIVTAVQRRSLIGMALGLVLSCGALIVLASALFDLTGDEPSTGQVVAVAVIAFAAAGAVLLAALHLAAARANRGAEDLEPW